MAYICPHCKNPINDDEALLCLYCGESLKRNIGVMGKLKYPKPKTIIIVLVGLILLSFILLFIFYTRELKKTPKAPYAPNVTTTIKKAAIITM